MVETSSFTGHNGNLQGFKLYTTTISRDARGILNDGKTKCRELFSMRPGKVILILVGKIKLNLTRRYRGIYSRVEPHSNHPLNSRLNSP
jgi:hypothetical protein